MLLILIQIITVTNDPHTTWNVTTARLLVLQMNPLSYQSQGQWFVIKNSLRQRHIVSTVVKQF